MDARQKQAMIRRRQKRRRAAGLLFAVVLILIAVILLVKDHHNKTEDDDDRTIVTSTQAIPLASFAELGTQSIVYDPETDADASETPRTGTTASETSRADTTTSEPARTSTDNARDPSAQSSAVGNETTLHNYQSGKDYAYAYAGFTPQIINVDQANWELMLVNRDYMLPQNYETDLAEAAKGTGVRMDARVAPHYQEMYDAAKADGITLTPLSGHRRISTQKTNFENKIKYYQNQGYSKEVATQKAAEIILPPGTSEHNAGLCMDIISLDVTFENTKAFAWLQEHAQDYGFILRYPKGKEDVTKITYEPWHWRYVGVENAKKIKASGKCLEEYLGKN